MIAGLNQLAVRAQTGGSRSSAARCRRSRTRRSSRLLDTRGRGEAAGGQRMDSGERGVRRGDRFRPALRDPSTRPGCCRNGIAATTCIRAISATSRWATRSTGAVRLGAPTHVIPAQAGIQSDGPDLSSGFPDNPARCSVPASECASGGIRCLSNSVRTPPLVGFHTLRKSPHVRRGNPPATAAGCTSRWRPGEA